MMKNKEKNWKQKIPSDNKICCSLSLHCVKQTQSVKWWILLNSAQHTVSEESMQLHAVSKKKHRACHAVHSWFHRPYYAKCPFWSSQWTMKCDWHVVFFQLAFTSNGINQSATITKGKITKSNCTRKYWMIFADRKN